MTTKAINWGAVKMASDLLEEIKLLEGEKRDMLAVLEQVAEYLNDRADAEYGPVTGYDEATITLLMTVDRIIKQVTEE